ncbi:MAG: sigma-54-dependent Fis family transcriptional regulator [Clostridiales bacterium]|jgi:PAS domain S-box-containing protein|nr:sigma-54-dependent Fis family transcriptional regulator [Clostridiales bacterium]
MTDGLSLEKRADRIQKSWQGFIVRGKMESYVVRDMIASSWERSLAAGVNPYGNLRYLVTSKSNTNNRNLIKISRPFLDNLHTFIKGSDFMVLLTDDEGTIVKILGDPVIMQKMRSFPFWEGANWDEESCGTNCIGLAIREKMPIQVFASEHFNQQLHIIVGSAAPFFNPSGKFLGVVALVGFYSDFHPHTLGMVVASVKAIENQLLFIEANQSLKRSYKEATTIMEEMTAGLISVDTLGSITMLNTLARKMLGITAQDWLGKNIGELFGEKSPLIHALHEGRGFSDREIKMNDSGVTKRFSCSANVMKDENNQTLGMVVTIHEDKAIRRLVNRALGSQATFTFDDILGEHGTLKKAINVAIRAAASDSTLLIQGESGTGKEMFAQAIHNSSERARAPFVAINCAGIPRELVESELFGYEAGAFTGAKKEGRPGKFELAQGGTIFLDEIGDMSLETQAHLLRVLQDKTITRLSGQFPIPIDVRVIVATHRDLISLVDEGTYRLDLFYRINVINLKVPSLRDRGTDVLLLARLFLEKISGKMGLPITPVLSAKCEDRLLSYPWPGNVRELQNVIEQAMFISNFAAELREEHLPEKLLNGRKEMPGHLTQMALELQESMHIKHTLDVCGGNISRCAKILGIARNTLYRKIEKYDLSRRGEGGN